MERINNSAGILFTEEAVKMVRARFGRKKPDGLEYFTDACGNLVMRASGTEDLTIQEGGWFDLSDFELVARVVIVVG